MKVMLTLIFTIATLSYSLFAVESSISVSGDADVWYDFQTNKALNSQYILIDFNGKLSETVTATVEGVILTENSKGNLIYPPAGAAPASSRWGTVGFNGAWLTWNSPIGIEISAGDLVYAFGGFNYYLYKNWSMITAQFFPRGVEVSKSFGSLSITGFGGALDNEDGSKTVGLNLKYSASDKINISGYAVGTKIDTLINTNFGAECNVEFGIANIKVALGAITKESETGINALIEPSLSFGNFSLAATFYYKSDDSAVIDFAPNENWFTYLEPGYSFNDYLAIGLPLEYHVYSDADADKQIWLVPTLYIYPSKNVEWWIWGQLVKPSEGDNLLYTGSEIIFNF